MIAVWVAIIAVVVLLFLVLPAALKVVAQYERGVVLRLGRFVGLKEPGLRIIIPFIDRMWKVDTRIVTMDVPSQEVITRDNVTIRVDAVVYLRVINADDAVLKVADYIRATSLIAQTTLRSVLGQSELDEILGQRDKINATLQHIVDEQTDPWGVKVSTVEIKDVLLPEPMQRAMAAQAEADSKTEIPLKMRHFLYLGLIGLSAAALSQWLAPMIPEIKKIIRSVSIEECNALARRVATLDSQRQIKNLLRDTIAQILPEI